MGGQNTPEAARQCLGALQPDSSSSASAPPCRRDPDSGRAKLRDYLDTWTPVEPLPLHLPQREVDLPPLPLDLRSLTAMEPEVAAGIMLQRLEVSPARVAAVMLRFGLAGSSPVLLQTSSLQ